ncbi:type II toxin-antitoxin system RelE/ParE family toxin [Tardiphaga alba]|uniref:Type II toxin-antitoxin system RelE/ParE family toxin n=1 Tax=Tardiphaga alba TaxID=340268 RepID=A0ABX8AE98_9BRAD|nr:type II toxin-antitoxin system RelE/ParE family toxin [Tardiphaga alba]QUS40743.1 type II toxin-antitoxin system RelE/ParE family toxin [Tardiphaga alba]
MIEIKSSVEFDQWIDTLRDRRAAAKVFDRIERLQDGNPGDVKPVGDGVLEMRINYGPGYRVYYTHRGAVIVLLLCGGDKSTQAKDIRRAIQIAGRW